MAGNFAPYPRNGYGNVQTTYDASARNPVGICWGPPTPFPTTSVFSTTAGSSTAGLGAPPVYKYVYFYDANALTGTLQAAPAPVYWIDESFTTVTSNAANAYSTTGGASIAGYFMPNTTALGTSNTGAQWYAQVLQSYCWIQIGGFLAGAYAPTTQTGAGIGSVIYGSTTGSWASTVNTTLAASARALGVQWSAIASSACDVLVGGQGVFWGS